MADRAPISPSRSEPTPDAIRDRLGALAEREGVRVLYACESGSRAWGFASPDSDYDVRFIYLRPTAWYLSIDLPSQPDTIDEPVDDVWDLAGWDLRKALQLFRKSNPPLFEWLDSPIVYVEQGAAASRLRELRPTFYSPTASAHHYLSMTRNNLRRHAAAEDAKLKRYFYILRPLLAVRWVERELGPVPMAFARLVAATVDDDEVRRAIDELLARKRDTSELGRGPKVPVLEGFIQTETARLEACATGLDARKADSAPLDALFIEILDETWADHGGCPSSGPLMS